MNCSCSASSYDGDGYYSSRHRIAAKESKCPECGRTIKKGEKYLFMTTFYEGSIVNNKVCKDCESIINNFFEDGFMYGSIYEDLESYIDAAWNDDLPSNCISKLTPDAKESVCDILQRYQEK